MEVNGCSPSLVLKTDSVGSETEVLKARPNRLNIVSMGTSSRFSAVVPRVSCEHSRIRIYFVDPHGRPAGAGRGTSIALDSDSFELVLAVAIVKEVNADTATLDD
jgi:hypothetical protein